MKLEIVHKNEVAADPSTQIANALANIAASRFVAAKAGKARF